jgi:hypothetical protein
VEVDFLAGEYEGTGPKHRTQPVHAGRARKARGCDLAFDLFVETEISGVLPEGGRDRALVRVSSLVSFLVMKGMALHDRLKEKDAWDIYFCLTNYPGGMDALAHEIAPHDLFHAMVVESTAYTQFHQEHKTCTPAIWTAFGPHAPFPGTLDLTWRQVLGQNVSVRTALFSRRRWDVPLSRARARSNPPSQFFVQDEELWSF